MPGRTRKILVRVAVLGITLWAGRDAVDSLRSVGGAEGSGIAMRIAVVLQQLRGEAAPPRGVDGNTAADSETDIVLTSPKRQSTGDGASTHLGVDLEAFAHAAPPSEAVDLRGGRALCSPPTRAPPAA